MYRILVSMKRVLLVLVTSFVLLFSSNSLAGSFSFGLSLQSFSSISFIPFPVGHIGYDFGSASEGFSLEATILPFLIINHIGAQGFYRIPALDNGSNVYVGAGASLTFVILAFPDAGGAGGFGHVYGLVGWEAPINRDYTYFLEVAPGVNPTFGSFLLRISLGLRAHRTEFPTRF
jgi:hypothetical protein